MINAQCTNCRVNPKRLQYPIHLNTTQGAEKMNGKAKYPPQDIQERTFQFAVRVVKTVNRLPRKLGSVEVAKQLVRSGTSVGANVHEADGAESHADFVHKIKLARKEALESRFWLRLINEAVLENDSEILSLKDESDQ